MSTRTRKPTVESVDAIAHALPNEYAPAVPLGELVPFPGNPKQHDLGAIITSIEQNGVADVIKVQRSTRYVLGGHGTLEALRILGHFTAQVLYIDCDDRTARRLVLAYNRTTELGGIDERALAEFLTPLARADDLLGSGFDGDDLDALKLDLFGTQEPDEAEKEDALPPVPAQPITKRGDVILLGRHRLVCGDATVREHVERLMDGATMQMAYCDPPYGVSIVSEAGVVSSGLAPGPALRKGKVGGDKAFGSSRGKVGTIDRGMKAKPIIESNTYAAMIGDDTTRTAIAAYGIVAALKIKTQIFWGGNYYAEALPPSSCWIVWDKDNGESFFADAELAWTNQKTAVRICKHQWNGLIKGSERGQKRVHATQKPVALAEWCFMKYGSPGDNVLDLFGGSGSSLLAAEKCGRTAYLMEMSEAYCDVIVGRWERATGLTAERVAA